MKELFDWAYYGFIDAVEIAADKLYTFCAPMFVVMTFPIWIIPYAIYKRMTERG